MQIIKGFFTKISSFCLAFGPICEKQNCFLEFRKSGKYNYSEPSSETNSVFCLNKFSKSIIYSQATLVKVRKILSLTTEELKAL
jgi:hypothetical protein